MVFDFTTNKIFGYDPKNSPDNLDEMFSNFSNGLMSFPLNIPGIIFHDCMKVKITVSLDFGIVGGSGEKYLG